MVGLGNRNNLALQSSKKCVQLEENDINEHYIFPIQTLLQEFAAMSQQEAQETVDKMKVTLKVDLHTPFRTSTGQLKYLFATTPVFHPSQRLSFKIKPLVTPFVEFFTPAVLRPHGI